MIKAYINMGKVPVLEFHPGGFGPNEDEGFFCIIRYPYDPAHTEPLQQSGLIILNSNYDIAIKQFLDLVDVQTKHYRSLGILS